MKSEFTLAFNEVLEEKGLPKEVILTALESAMVSAYRRSVNASNAQHVEARIDPDTGEVYIYAEKEVSEDIADERTEVTLEEARKVNPLAEIGDMVIVETTPEDFGRVAAQNARQVIQQRIREAERKVQLDHFTKQTGEIISGTVQSFNARGITVLLDLKAEATLLKKEMIPGERFRAHDRVRALVAEVKDSPRGPQILLSRAHRDFLRRLLENEVPEIFHGIVEIRSIAREPGQRAKIAVSASQQGIDPVGACVGMRGVRIQTIVRELHDEKIDVIEYSSDPSVYISKAISPARVTGVYMTPDAEGNRVATVVVPEDQLSLAIGRDGQNARLAAKLTGYRIDIKSLSEAATDSLRKLREDASYAEMAEREAENLPRIEELLKKKSEGRALSMEENDALGRFVDRVERRAAVKRKEQEETENIQQQALRKQIPEAAFTTPILDTEIKEHIIVILQEAGYETLGDLMLQMLGDKDKILALNGIGAKAIQELEAVVSAKVIKPEEPAVETTPEVEVVAEAEMPAEPMEAGIEVPVEAVADAEVVPAEAVVIEAVADAEAPAEQAAVAAVEEAEKEETSFDDWFKVASTDIGYISTTDLENEDEESQSGKEAPHGKKKKKKAKKGYNEYDPDTNSFLDSKRATGTEWEDW